MFNSKRFFFLSLLLLITTNVAAQEVALDMKPDPALKNSLDQFNDQINSLAQIPIDVQEFLKEDSQSNIYSLYKYFPLETIRDLEQLDLGNIDSKWIVVNKLISDIEYESKVNAQFELAAAALAGMEKGTNVILFIQNLILVVSDLNDLANPWASTSLKNGIDYIDEWGGNIGIATAAISQLVENEKTEKLTAGIGLGVFALSKTLGSIFGKKLEDEVTTLGLTSSMYDYLVTVNLELDGYIGANEAYLKRLEDARIGYQDANTDNKKKAVVANVWALISDYEDVVSQIPGFIKLFEGIKDQDFYKRLKEEGNHGPVVTQWVNKADSVIKQSGELKGSYDKDIKPFLQLSNEVRSNLVPQG